MYYSRSGIVVIVTVAGNGDVPAPLTAAIVTTYVTLDCSCDRVVLKPITDLLGPVLLPLILYVIKYSVILP